jgi:hypothetical protein
MGFKLGRTTTRTYSRSGKQMPKGCLIPFFLIFFLAGAVFLTVFVIMPLVNYQRSASWEKVSCKVLESKVHVSQGEDSTSYYVDMTFEYEYKGTKYTSDKYSNVGNINKSRKKCQEIINANPSGHRSTCLVNPKEPAEAYYTRELSKNMLFGFIPLIFIAVGLGGIYFTIKSPGSKKWRREKVMGVDGDYLNKVLGINDYDRNQMAGQVVMKSRNSPLKKLISSFVIAVFWNGITWTVIIVSGVWAGIRNGDFEWFLTIFFSIFALIGLVMVFAFLASILNMFNPRIRMVMDKRIIPLGNTVNIDWDFFGNVYRIQSMTIKLTGTEEAKYTVGTNTYTDRNEFYTEVLVDTRQINEIMNGNLKLTIPENTMHSLSVNNNKIIWSIKVNGVISFWPDVSEDFDIIVGPKNM